MAFFFTRSINTITPWAILIHIDERLDIEMKIVSCIFFRCSPLLWASCRKTFQEIIIICRINSPRNVIKSCPLRYIYIVNFTLSPSEQKKIHCTIGLLKCDNVGYGSRILKYDTPLKCNADKKVSAIKCV